MSKASIMLQYAMKKGIPVVYSIKELEELLEKDSEIKEVVFIDIGED